MKLLHRLALGTSLCVSLGLSGIISGVSVVINEEPITLYEVYKYSERFDIPRKEAVDVLVRQKLEEAQIKKLGITADMFEVDAYIENLAADNGLSTYEFADVLKERDIDMQEYREDVKMKIKRNKLYQRIYADKLSSIEEKEVRRFYNNNQQEFEIAEKFEVRVYTSDNKETLETLKKNPMLRPNGVNIEKRTLQSENMNNRLKSLLNSTKENNFTQIIEVGGQATLFFIQEKKGKRTLEFDKVKDSIYQVLNNQKREKAVDDYFEELKASASIEVLRNPT